MASQRRSRFDHFSLNNAAMELTVGSRRALLVIAP
jgi:hypothetical protein